MKRMIDYDRTIYHEEPDSKIAYQICQLNTNYIPTIIIADFMFRKSETAIVIDLSWDTLILIKFIKV